MVKGCAHRVCAFPGSFEPRVKRGQMMMRFVRRRRMARLVAVRLNVIRAEILAERMVIR